MHEQLGTGGLFGRMKQRLVGARVALLMMYVGVSHSGYRIAVSS